MVADACTGGLQVTFGTSLARKAQLIYDGVLLAQFNWREQLEDTRLPEGHSVELAVVQTMLTITVDGRQSVSEFPLANWNPAPNWRFLSGHEIRLHISATQSTALL